MKRTGRVTPPLGPGKRVALLMGQDLGYCRGVFRGIHAYAVHQRRWILRDSPPDAQILPSLREWQPQGIIAHLFDGEFARRVMALRKPLVNITNTLARLKAPLVEVDHLRVGQLAACPSERPLSRGSPARSSDPAIAWRRSSSRASRNMR